MGLAERKRRDRGRRAPPFPFGIAELRAAMRLIGEA
jgi:hypothetical protein